MTRADLPDAAHIPRHAHRYSLWIDEERRVFPYTHFPRHRAEEAA